MKINIDIKGLDRVIKNLDDIGRKQIPYAAAKAVLDTGNDAVRELRKEMDRVFDKPTSYVKKGIAVYPEGHLLMGVGSSDYLAKLRVLKKMKNPTVIIAPKEEGASKGTPVQDILAPHIKGGSRRMKRGERRFGRYYAPGAGAKIDRYGNISRGEIAKVLSAVGLNPLAVPFHKKARKKAKRYFATQKAVFRRGESGIIPLLKFIKQPQYKKRFNFYGVVRRVANKKLAANFKRAFRQAMRTAKK